MASTIFVLCFGGAEAQGYPDGQALTWLSTTVPVKLGVPVVGHFTMVDVPPTEIDVRTVSAAQEPVVAKEPLEVTYHCDQGCRLGPRAEVKLGVNAEQLDKEDVACSSGHFGPVTNPTQHHLLGPRYDRLCHGPHRREGAANTYKAFSVRKANVFLQGSWSACRAEWQLRSVWTVVEVVDRKPVSKTTPSSQSTILIGRVTLHRVDAKLGGAKLRDRRWIAILASAPQLVREAGTEWSTNHEAWACEQQNARPPLTKIRWVWCDRLQCWAKTGKARSAPTEASATMSVWTWDLLRLEPGSAWLRGTMQADEPAAVSGAATLNVPTLALHI